MTPRARTRPRNRLSSIPPQLPRPNPSAGSLASSFGSGSSGSSASMSASVTAERTSEQPMLQHTATPKPDSARKPSGMRISTRVFNNEASFCPIFTYAPPSLMPRLLLISTRFYSCPPASLRKPNRHNKSNPISPASSL
jgi:hypothetical protein